MTRQVFALDLVRDAELIAAYEARHAPGAVWPAVVADIRAQGFDEMEIWRVDDRLVMIAEQGDDGTAHRDPALAPVVARWEAEMDAFQRPIRAEGPKWAPMVRIFALSEQA